MDKYIGRLLDNRYEILEIIGTGGMAVVYKARCHRLNRLVAIKILKDDYLGDEDFRSRFHSESQAVAMLSHPNIVSVYDVSTSVMADYIVMELIEGITLKQYMEKKGVLNWKETLHFAMQIGKALEHAHSRGIVHRDIKPHNIMVLKNGSVKVTDFGIARMMSKGNTLTKEALGSVHYISPEQAKGGRVDDRSDIYSLGTVMYEMIAGRPPYDGESPVAVAIQHINGGAVMPSVLNPNIPGGLEQIIVKAMQIEPGNRYAGATAMLRDMDEFRKDPAMLFDYNGTGGEVIRTGRTPIVFDPTTHTGGKTTTAERVADRANGKTTKPVEVSNRTVTQTDAARAREQARRRREEERRRNRITLVAVLVCLLALLITLVVIFVLAGSKISVPNLIGMNITDAEHNYPDLKFNIIDERYSTEYDAGEIIDQQPGKGEKIRKKDTVDVIVSIGPEEIEDDEQETTEDEITLTNLVGLDEEKARTLLLSYNLDIEIYTKPAFSDTYQKGKVMGMEPGEGTVLTKGSQVTLTISQGHQPKIENLKGKTEEFAVDYLDDLELNLTIKITTEYDEEVEKGCIISTDPVAGELLDYGQRVELIVSAGSEVEKQILPDVKGMDAFNAMQKLVNAGFKNVEREYTSHSISKDLVVDMSVEPDVEYDVTTKIILYVSDGSQTVTTPTGKQITINVPTASDLVEEGIVTEDGVDTVIVSLKQGDTAVYTSEPVALGSTITVTLNGEGSQDYVLCINDQSYKLITVNFTANENS